MPIAASRKKELDTLCRKFRMDVIETLHTVQTGHPGGSLSVCEILTALYFEKAAVDASRSTLPDRDRIILTKGHAAPMLYRILAEKGFFPVSELATLRQLDTRLQGHPCAKETPGVELSTGPLGLGLSAALGMACGLRMSKSAARVYAVLGDGELDEGTVWEACMAAAKFGAENLTILVDNNHVQLDGTNDQIMPLGDLKAKFSAFGLAVLSCDGHDISALCDAIDQANALPRPAVILAQTIKGKGVSFMEGKNLWHGKAICDEEYAAAMAELGREQ